MVTYPAPHGVEAIRVHDDEIVAFGRGAECAVRFAYAPVVDRGVPRVAGSLAVVNGRVFVESTGTLGGRALTIRTDVGVTRHLPVGDGVSPRERHFEIVVHGESGPWKIGVAARPRSVSVSALSSADPPTRHHELVLTPVQRRVLEAYSEPVRRGRLEPATHRQVATALSYHPNTVREVLYEIWARMFAEQIPMPDADDKRVAVVEAARLHGLVGFE